MTKKVLIPIAVVVALVALALFRLDNVKAAASYLNFDQTATATTSPTYMTPGTATTTLSLAANESDSEDLFIQLNASSTATTLGWYYEYSNNNVDWFKHNEIVISQSNYSTSTFASSTVAYRWTASVAGMNRIVLSVPEHSANFKRVVFSLPIGSANASLWAQVVTKKNAN